MVTMESISGKHIKQLTVAEKEWLAANLMKQVALSLAKYAVAREISARVGA